MSKPRQTEREQQSVASADLEPRLDAEVIADLDVPGEDADNVLGTRSTCPMCPTQQA
jgi:hypothetical protein